MAAAIEILERSATPMTFKRMLVFMGILDCCLTITPAREMPKRRECSGLRTRHQIKFCPFGSFDFM
jgi:hypothetical protein